MIEIPIRYLTFARTWFSISEFYHLKIGALFYPVQWCVTAFFALDLLFPFYWLVFESKKIIMVTQPFFVTTYFRAFSNWFKFVVFNLSIPFCPNKRVYLKIFPFDLFISVKFYYFFLKTKYSYARVNEPKKIRDGTWA